jgi:Spy/CpxP family protein refolding chaperone
MLKKLLAGAALASALLLSPLSVSAEPAPQGEPMVEHGHMDRHGGDHEWRHDRRHHHHRDHRDHHHHHHHHD